MSIYFIVNLSGEMGNVSGGEDAEVGSVCNLASTMSNQEKLTSLHLSSRNGK